MNRRCVLGLAFALLLALATGACKESGGGAAAEGPAAAQAIGVAECAACGMVVREQPAPRGQLLHRDGKRVWFCSVGDLAQYLAAPSPHGKPRAVWVEALAADAAPRRPDVGVRPWHLAESLHHVLGIDRPGIMGAPVMSYEDAAAARAVVERAGGEILPWPELVKRLVAKGHKPDDGAGGTHPTRDEREISK